MIVFFRGKTEEGQYINTEHIEKEVVHTKESNTAYTDNWDSNGNKCIKCEMTFTRKEALKFHMKRHHGLNKRNVCPYCYYKRRPC